MNLPLVTNIHEIHVKHYLLKLVRKPKTKTFECESVIFPQLAVYAKNVLRNGQENKHGKFECI